MPLNNDSDPPPQQINHWVLLPGMDGTCLLFEEFLCACSKICPGTTFETIPLPKQDLSYFELAAYAAERLPRDTPFGLLAESFSGPIALLLASQARPPMKAMCLAASFAKCPRRTYRPLSIAQGAVPGLASLAGAFGPLFLMNSQTPRCYKNKLKHCLSLTGSATLKSRMRQAVRIDLTTLLSRMRTPTLILNAQKDRIIPKAASRALLGIPGSIEHSIDAPHFLLQTRPLECAALLAEFTKTLCQPCA